MPRNAFAELAHIIAELNTEVFARKSENPNKPLTRPGFINEKVILGDSVLTNNYTEANPTFIWGPGGISDTAVGAAVDTSVRWGFTGQWA